MDFFFNSPSEVYPLHRSCHYLIILLPLIQMAIKFIIIIIIIIIIIPFYLLDSSNDHFVI